jgi:hypothetical protein
MQSLAENAAACTVARAVVGDFIRLLLLLLQAVWAVSPVAFYSLLFSSSAVLAEMDGSMDG